MDKSFASFYNWSISDAHKRLLLESGDVGAIEQTIMEKIFYDSPFYEKESNNEQLRTQRVTMNY